MPQVLACESCSAVKMLSCDCIVALLCCELSVGSVTECRTAECRTAKMTEGVGRGRVVNARWQRVPHSGGCNTETVGGTDSRLVFAERRERVGVS